MKSKIKKRIRNKRLQIGVIGPAGREEYLAGGGASAETLKLAREVGRLLAEQGVTVVTGGKSGIMESAAEGAKSVGGMTVGVVSGGNRFVANPFIDIEIPTGVSASGYDEFLLVLMCDALIVLGGGAGTLEEITIAYRNKKPMVVLQGVPGWGRKLLSERYLDSRKTVKLEKASTAPEAVSKVISLATAILVK